MQIQMYTDGGARNNPGPAGAGVHIITPDNEYTLQEYLGVKTNNQAEYEALILGLTYLIDHDFTAEQVRVYMDSELVVKQIKGQYRVKNPHMKPLYETARGLIEKFAMIEFNHIPREKNAVADQAVNDVIDAQHGTTTTPH